MYRSPKGFHVGVTGYCPAAQYDVAAIHNQPAMHNLGTPAAQSATVVATGVTGNSVATTLFGLATAWTSDSTYGRNIRVTPSGDPGAAGGAIIVRGQDYRGQPIGERFNGTSGSSAVIVGAKAFYRVDAVYTVIATTNAITWSIGTGVLLGLPFKGVIEWYKENDVLTALPLANHIQPVLTDPATVLTGDPRGTIDPVVDPTGAINYKIGIVGDPTVNAAGNGGLYGIKQVVI
jgi:hypothetical protein